MQLADVLIIKVIIQIMNQKSDLNSFLSKKERDMLNLFLRENRGNYRKSVYRIVFEGVKDEDS